MGLNTQQQQIVESITLENTTVLKKLMNSLENPGSVEESLDENGILDQDPIAFPIEEKEIELLKNQSVTSSNTSLDHGKEDVEKTVKEKYSVMIDRKVVKVSKSTRKDMEQLSLEEMQVTAQELQNWSTSVLDQPEILIQDLNPNIPDPDRPTSVPAHEAVDIGALDVLLNACKPSLFDSKPQIRLNVVQEVAPPDLLVKNLQKTLGVNIGQVKEKSKVSVAFGYQNKEIKARPKYGNWFIKPSLWSEKMKSQNSGCSKTKISSPQGLHEMIQKKLEEIKTNQEKEEAEIIAENSVKGVSRLK